MSQDTPADNGAQGASATTSTGPIVANELKANPQRPDLPGMTALATLGTPPGFADLRREYAVTGDDAVTDAVPVRRVPELDEIMPALDRNGKRGALNAAERDYKERRALLATVLGQMVPAHAELAERLATMERELAESRRTNEVLKGDVKRLAAENRELKGDTASLTDQLGKTREAHERTKVLSHVSYIAATQFCRLTGMELTDFHTVVNDWVQCKIKGHPEVSITIQPAVRSIRIIQSTGYINHFDLTDTGQIDPRHALALLTLLGIKRDLREALSTLAVDELFGSTPEGDRNRRIARSIGGLALLSTLSVPEETKGDPYGFGGRLKY